MKKNDLNSSLGFEKGDSMFALIKKRILLVSFLCLILFSSILNAQDNNLTLDLKNVKIKDVFPVIESQSKYRFFYNAELSDINKTVNITVKEAKMEEVLTQLFSNTDLAYTILEKNNKIVIAPKGTTTQQRTITGTIVDINTGEFLIGVNVVIEGTTKGLVSDINGKFSIDVPNINTVLNISYIGYLTEKINVGSQSSLIVKMTPEVKKVDDVVIVGYGTQKRLSVTGSISTAKGEEVAESPVANISNSLAGRVSGVSMRPNGGQPGKDDPMIHIRGIATTGNNAPLIVVDGIIRNNINQIDPNTIESVTVLKDAAAVAPYGMGGANGVILITTKSGKSGETNLTFSTYFGVQTPTVYPKMLSAKDYMILNDSAFGSNQKYLIDNYDKLHAKNPNKFPNSNFYRDVSNLSTPVQNYNVQLSGGQDKFKYFVGMGYYNQDGMFENLGYNRYNYNMKLEAQATSTTKVIASVHSAIENVKSTSTDPNSIIWNGVKAIPTDPMVYSNGLWGSSQGFSPVGTIKAGYNNSNAKTLMSSVSIEQQIPFIKGLSLKGSFSYDPTDSLTKNWTTPINYYHVADTSASKFIYNKVPGSVKPALSENYKQTANYTYQAYLNYQNTFGKHEVTILGVAEARKSTLANLYASNQNYLIQVDELSLGSSSPANFGVGGGSQTGSQVGYIYRLGDNYDNKYIVEVAGRYDGHYTFAPDKRYGYFPSFSAAWRISEEGFLKDKFAWLYNLKLRGSWGQSGNLPYIGGKLAEFQYLNGYNLFANAYAFGSGSVVSGSRIPQESNPAITWETSTKRDIGFDLSLFRGMLNFEADYFHEDRNNMLLQPSDTVPVEYGISLALENAGKMSNDGVEFSLNYNYKFPNGIEVGFSANYSYVKNKLVKTVETSATYNNLNRRITGRQLNTPFGLHAMGLFTMADDKNYDGKIDSLDGYKVIQFGDIHPGDVKYADLNNDGKIDVNDQTVIGYPTYPSVTYGFTPTISWKGFDLSLFFQGVAQASINIANFQSQPFSNNKSNSSYEYFNNYWRTDRQNAIYPRLGDYGALSDNNTQYSDFWMRNSSYLRLKNLVFGYTIPAQFTKFIGIKTLRAYYSGQNLFTFSSVKFIDPEEAVVNTAATYFYPLQKVNTFGLDVTF